MQTKKDTIYKELVIEQKGLVRGVKGTNFFDKKLYKRVFKSGREINVKMSNSPKNIQQNPQLDTAIGRNCMECNSPLFMLKWVCICGKNGTLELCRCCFDKYDK